MDLASTIYLICFFVGLGFAVISTILGSFGHIGGGDHDVDMGGHGVDVDGHDVDVGDHDLDTSGHVEHPDSIGADSGEVHFSPLSPITIATFITCFGGVGFIFNQNLRSPLFISIPIAVGSGFAVAGAVFFLFYKIFKTTQASSEYTRESLLDIEAEVITPIPANAVGAIAYVAKGSRYTAPARSEEQEAIAKHEIVRITRIVGNTIYVREIPDEKLRRLASEIVDET